MSGGFRINTGLGVLQENISILETLTATTLDPATNVTIIASNVTLTTAQLQESITARGINVDANGMTALRYLYVGDADTAAAAATLQSTLGLTNLNDSVMMKFNITINVNNSFNLSFGNNASGFTQNFVRTSLNGGGSNETQVMIAHGSPSQVIFVQVTATNVTAGAEIITFNIYGTRADNILGFGSATLVAGATVAIGTNSSTPNTIDGIFFCRQAIGGAAGSLSITSFVANTSFAIQSDSGTDTSTVNWLTIGP